MPDGLNSHRHWTRPCSALQNNPLYSRLYDEGDESETLNLQFLAHCSLDAIGDKGDYASGPLMLMRSGIDMEQLTIRWQADEHVQH